MQYQLSVLGQRGKRKGERGKGKEERGKRKGKREKGKGKSEKGKGGLPFTLKLSPLTVHSQMQLKGTLAYYYLMP